MSRLDWWLPWFSTILVAAGVWTQTSRAAEEDLLNDNISFSGATLSLRPFVTVPGNPSQNQTDISSMTTRPGDARLYVTMVEGEIYVIDEEENGNTTPTVWFNVADAVEAATDRSQFDDDGQDGLRSTAFHPDFNDEGAPGYGKFYTTLLETRPSNPSNHHYLGSPFGGDNRADSVLVEWTYDHDTGQVDPNSYRELFRMRLPVKDHMIKQARFNQFARPGDEDYGLLYITHGDSSSQESLEDRPQHLDNGLGKMLRINPLQSAGDSYTIPETNPFAGSADPNVLQEIYAYGMRNPHYYFFNPDDQGNTHILVSDIGRSNVEEINSVVAGGNYGWTKREGTFVHRQGTNYPNDPGPDDAGYFTGVLPLDDDEVDVVDAQGNRYIYPVAQYDHNGSGVNVGDDFTAHAVAGGFVIRNGSDPDLHNQYVFLNFSFNHGHVYQADFDDILNAVTQLDPTNSSRDHPSELTQAELQRFMLAFDHDDNPNTPPLEYDDFNDLLSMGGFARNNARFGQGVFGEMYISSKWTGTIYLVTNSVPLEGDYNKNHAVDAGDYTVWRDMLGQEGYLLAADGDGDGDVDLDDYDVWVTHFGQTWSGAGAASVVGNAVPEPASWTLAAIAVVYFARWRPRGLSCPRRRLA